MLGKSFFHYLRYQRGLSQARTDTSSSEMAALRKYSSEKRNIAELGVYHGASSRVLRESMAVDGNLWCVDPFFKDRLGFSYGLSIAKREINKSRNGNMTILRGLSQEVAKGWKQQIEFLFIDADHSYDAVKSDWENWSVFVEV